MGTPKQSGASPLLRMFIEAIYLTIVAKDKSANYRTSIRRAAKLLEAILGRPARLDDLTTPNLKAVQYAPEASAVGLGEAARHTLRRRLRSVWGYAATLGYVDQPPRDRTRKAKPKPVKADALPTRAPEPGTLLADVAAMSLESAIDPTTEEQYAIAIRCYGRYLGHTARREDLDETKVNKWIRSLEGTKSPTTIHNRKRGITPVWNWLALQNLVPYYNPRRLRRTRKQYGPVRAWSFTNVQALLAGASDVTGVMRSGIEPSAFMRALVLVTFDTGLRPGDIRRLRSESIDLRTRTVELVQHKTRQPHRAVIGEVTATALQAIRFDSRERVFPLSKDGLENWLARLYAAAEKHGFQRRSGQSLATLRKSHATERARADGIESAARSLGHISGTRTALVHYIAADAIAPLEPLACMDRLLDSAK